MNKQRFTLIELLIVIAIIAILAGMLLPALSKTKITAQGASCVNQLGQMGKAWSLYLQDFNDLYPNASYIAADAEGDNLVTSYGRIWSDKIAYYLFPKVKTSLATGVKRHKELNYIFLCPSQTHWKKGVCSRYDVKDIFCGSYGFNTSYLSKRASRVKNNSKNMLVSEHRQIDNRLCPNYDLNYWVNRNFVGASDVTIVYPYHHASKVKMLFGDFHVGDTDQSQVVGLQHPECWSDASFTEM